MGNPTKYRDMACQWEKGRQLAQISDGANTVSFTYDVFGIRTSKTVGNLVTHYVYENGKLLRQKTGNDTIDFIYGRDGVIGFTLNNVPYLYRKNLFGDVVEIYDQSGNAVGKYSYTAFGECDVVLDTDGIATSNPIRYRGYYYDKELNLYYLKSRYYDPEVGRFITIDDLSYLDPENINGLNLYAYCGNNPVMRVDENGNAWWEWLLGALLIVAVVAVTVVTAGAAALAIGTAIGVGSSLVGAAMVGATIGGLVAGGLEFISQGVATKWGDVDFGALAIESFTGAAYGAVSGMMGATTSAGLRLGLRGGIVAISGLNSALHGINSGKSAAEIWAEVGMSMAISVLLQSVMVGADAYIGKTSTSILELYKLDGRLFTMANKLLIGAVSAAKTLWRNSKDYIINWAKGW